MDLYEPSDLEIAIMDRMSLRLPPIGPLTEDQFESEQAYLRYCEESAREAEAQEAAGGRTICPCCAQRSVIHRAVCTLGYAGHPGAEFSDLAHCEKCGWEDLA